MNAAERKGYLNTYKGRKHGTQCSLLTLQALMATHIQQENLEDIFSKLLKYAFMP